jgi:DNA-binding NtrC family response regulator
MNNRPHEHQKSNARHAAPSTPLEGDSSAGTFRGAAQLHAGGTSALSGHRLRLLVIDDDLPVLRACKEIAQGVGFDVSATSTSEEARNFVKTHAPDVVLMDLKMPAGGLSLLEEIRAARPRSAVVVMTAFATVTSAVEAMRIGATDYLTKPFAMDELVGVLERAGQRRSFELESRRLTGQLQNQRGETMIGNSAEMVKLTRIVQKVATANHPVLIVGESGTGKEMVARAIHVSGPHANRRFAVLECGQLSPSVLESELFGYAPSALTGLSHAKEGALVSKEGGTLFLDGISEMPLDLQARLMRALQDKRVRTPGADLDLPVTVRVLAATTRNLQPLVESGEFRRDLYYRLAVVSLRTPPLRERGDDIALLAQYFLDRLRREGAASHRFGSDAMQRMAGYEWPGNVREMENAIERACAISSGPVLHLKDFPSQLQTGAEAYGESILRVDERVSGEPGKRSSQHLVSIAELEREAILNTVRQLQGDKLMAAKLLGIGKTTLYRKLKEYGIPDV